MSTPDMAAPEVTVACDKLRADAARWAESAAELRTAAQSAAGLTLTEKIPLLLRTRAAAAIAGYDQVKQTVTGVLDGGATVLSGFSGALNQIADTYEREDAEGAHRIAQAGEGQ